MSDSIDAVERTGRWATSTAGDVGESEAAAPGLSSPDQHPSASALSDVTVMMVDDEPIMTDVIQTYLEEAGYNRFVAISDPQLALESARLHRPGLVLLDLVMPGMSGFDVLAQLRADDLLRYTPVIVLTASSGASTKLRALELGATEFLAKPVDKSELVVRVRNSLVFKVYQDRLADEDALTGLPNRRAFVDRFRARLARWQPADVGLALLYLNLDRFGQVNDTLGSATGDRLLAAVAARLKRHTRSDDKAARDARTDATLLSRVGGDEFAVLLPEIASPGAAERVARRILAALSYPFKVDGRDLYMTPSVGIAIYPQDGRDDEALLRNASAAMRHAKESGRNTYCFYAQELNRASMERLALETQLRRAVQRNELLLYYQPKVDVGSGRVVGAEALLRWRHPQLGMVPPDRFIPIAEEAGLIVELSEWVIDRACAQIAAWRAQGLWDGLQVAVNISRQVIVAGGLVQATRAAVERHAVRGGDLIFELTESMLIDRTDVISTQMDELRKMGIQLSIDDFGTGYSSMAYLKRFPLDELKIDRSFVANAPTDRTDLAIVRAVIVLAHTLGLRVVAEGVETEVQRALLKKLSCDVFQGYLASPPLPSDGFVARMIELNRS